MTGKPLAVLAACLAVGLSTGCSHNSGQPSVADVAAQARKARDANQKIIDGIRNNPSLTDDQKAQMIARITRGRQTAAAP